jgi:uncharacterized protein (AIM24 family)
MPFNPYTLPSNDNVNPYSYCIDVQTEMFIRRGKMVAYYGALKFEALGSSMYDIMVRKSFNAPAYANAFVIVAGRGKLILGDYGNTIAAYNLEKGNLTVKSSHVLGYQSSLICQESTLPGYLNFLGDGTFLASSSGPVHFMEPPVRVDEDALLGWADCPSPSYRYDYEHVRGLMNMVGTAFGARQSGEERQLDFWGSGTVLIQSSEEPLYAPNALQNVMNQIPGLGGTELQQLMGVIQTRLQGRS